MAFEAFRAQSTARPRRGRRITYAVSIAVHAVLIAVGVAYSFWHVEELTPPALHVTFMSGSAPPPPPPAAGGGAAKKKVAVKPKVTPVLKKPDLVQPRDEEIAKPVEKPKPPQNDDDDDDAPGEKGGVKGGTIGGTAGGTIGGTIGGTPGGTIGGTVGSTGTGPVGPAKFLPPNLGALQKLTGSDPPFPPSLRKAGTEYAVIAKICVSPTGTVSTVTLMKRADPLLDEGVISTVKTWKFRPLMAGSAAIPFCYPATFQFKGQ